MEKQSLSEYIQKLYIYAIYIEKDSERARRLLNETIARVGRDETDINVYKKVMWQCKTTADTTDYEICDEEALIDPVWLKQKVTSVIAAMPEKKRNAVNAYIFDFEMPSDEQERSVVKEAIKEINREITSVEPDFNFMVDIPLMLASIDELKERCA